MKKIGIITSGGDCPGMNAAIRSIVRTCLYKGIVPFGFESGYKGLVENKIRQLGSIDVASTIQKGGTFLRSARSQEFKVEGGQQKAVSNIEKAGLDGLIVIGGDGSLTGANILFEKYGVPVVGLPGSIDNDIFGTDISIGADTALNTIVHSIDMINETASSHDRTFLIEVMGRNCGYLAVMASIAGGAEAVIIPEVKYDLKEIIEKIKQRYIQGKTRSIVIVAEGAGSAYDFGKTFALMGGFDTRITVLGHLQRGGSPTHFDRLLATKLGMAAVDHLEKGIFGVMMGIQKNCVTPTPLKEVITTKKELDPTLLKMAEVLSN